MCALRTQTDLIFRETRQCPLHFPSKAALQLGAAKLQWNHSGAVYCPSRYVFLSIQEDTLLFSLPFVITAIAIVSVLGGVWLTSIHAWSRRLVPFSGGLLVGVAVFWVLPEIAEFLSWISALAWMAAGVTALWLVDRFVYPVCPACSQPHGHDDCASTLHGFAAPLLLAAALHSALDGWSVSAAGGSVSLGTPFLVAIAVHKVPEGLALGVIARAAMDSRRAAFGWCALAESATLLGAAAEAVLAPHLGPTVLHALLALAGGTFLYLGAHAIHGEWERRPGTGLATLYPALAGIAAPSLFRLF